jgi:prevent-host-death family protein
MNISLAEAKARFSEIIRKAEAGQEIALTRHGKVVARIMPAAENADRHTLFGAMRGKIWIADDFNTLGPEWDDYLR